MRLNLFSLIPVKSIRAAACTADRRGTLGGLKKSGYVSKSIKDELRKNLREKIKKGEESFEGVWGYENSVIPELERAILSRHNINLLGLQGQAKTRLARLMVNLLDEWIPIVSGSEINDDPLNPISRYAKELIKEHGEKVSATIGMAQACRLLK